MAQIPDIIVSFAKALIMGLFGVLWFFIVDIHRMVKESHDGMIVYKEQIGAINKDIAFLKDRDIIYESRFMKLYAILPNNNFDVTPKQKEN